MAGGGGTRLWPLSRRARPKQMLNLIGEDTLFQGTLNRLQGFLPVERTLVVTTRDQYKELLQEAPTLSQQNFILEPEPKGTASVVGMAAMAVYAKDPDGITAILPADHFIRNTKLFHEILTGAYRAAQDGHLVTISIEPKYPATGYGYIHRSDLLKEYGNSSIFQVLEFREKPDRATAEQYCKSGDYGWNSGIFIWRADVILEEIKQHLPDLYKTLENCREKWRQKGQMDIDPTIWHEIEPQTIDYGIMEKSSNVVTIPARDLEWSDIGDWNSLSEIISKDEQGNIIHNCDSILSDARNLIIYSDNPKKLIAVQGAADLIIVETDDVLLVCNRKDSQKVKEIVANLKKSGKVKFL